MIETLRDIIWQINTDIDDLRIENEQFDEELDVYDEDNEKQKYPDIEKLRKIKEGMDTWVESLERSIDDLDEEINKYQKELVIENLK